MQTVTITEVRKASGSVRVHFATERDPDFYYAHSIWEEGNDYDGTMTFTMWSWVNHLREKNWWTSELEAEFIKQVKKVL